MTFVCFGKSKATGCLHNGLGRSTLEIASKLFYAAVARVGDQVEVIWHQHIGNQLAGPVLIECLELDEKSPAACRLGKDWEPVDAVARDIVERAREVEVRPFAGNVRIAGEDLLELLLWIDLEQGCAVPSFPT